MLKIAYQKYSFHLELEKNISFGVNPLFLLRSVLGNELKKMCCIFSTQSKSCLNCPVTQTCAYALLFETVHIAGNNSKTNAIHPFVIYSSQQTGEVYNYLNFDITLLGKGLNYFPYVYQAFALAGTQGLFKERVKYTIKHITANGEMVYDGSLLKLPQTTDLWSFRPDDAENQPDKLLIKFLTPFRFLPENKIPANVSYGDFLTSAYRRVRMLASLFDDCPPERDYKLTYLPKEEKTDTGWYDIKRYSARQKLEMQLGGFTGSMEINGNFSAAERSLLQAAELFNVGRSISFGLGKIGITAVN